MGTPRRAVPRERRGADVTVDISWGPGVSSVGEPSHVIFWNLGFRAPEKTSHADI